MIEFACHTWAFNDLTLPEALGTIARMGFRYVDIGSGPSLNAPRAAENPRKAAADIRDDLKRFNLKVSDLYLMLPRISLADDARREKELELYKALIPFAVELGTPGITLSPGLAHPAEDEDAHDRTVVMLREMVKAGKAADLDVSIEPHLDSMAQTPEAALKFLKDVPGLQLTLDWAHMVCQDIFHDDIIKLLPHTRHIQIRQAAREQLQVPFERGRIDVTRVMESLIVLAGYDGVVCIEYMNTPGWHGMETVDPITESSVLRDALRDARDRFGR
ncbi:MAG: sugar phosphate isomerase/epimerase [Anaerolineaceae bacterium]|nr:sugar phosphate isomerase/epimerase [Anaerolineaceae bacterium]